MAFLKRSRPRKGRHECGRRLDLDADHVARLVLDHEIDLDLVLVAIVEEAHALVGPGCFLSELRMNIALQNRPERPPVYPADQVRLPYGGALTGWMHSTK